METEHALVPLLAQFVVAGPVGQADGHPAVASEREERPVTLVVALREADQVVAVGGVHPEQRGATGGREAAGEPVGQRLAEVVVEVDRSR